MSSVIQQQPHHQQTMLAMGSNTLMPYHKRAQAAAFATQSATLLRSSNHSYNGAFQVSTCPKYQVYFDFWKLWCHIIKGHKLLHLLHNLLHYSDPQAFSKYLYWVYFDFWKLWCHTIKGHKLLHLLHNLLHYSYPQTCPKYLHRVYFDFWKLWCYTLDRGLA